MSEIATCPYDGTPIRFSPSGEERACKACDTDLQAHWEECSDPGCVRDAERLRFNGT